MAVIMRPPKDDEDDCSRQVWAGVIPLALTAGEPEPDPALVGGFEPPVSSPAVRSDDPGRNGR